MKVCLHRKPGCSHLSSAHIQTEELSTNKYTLNKKNVGIFWSITSLWAQSFVCVVTKLQKSQILNLTAELKKKTEGRKENYFLFNDALSTFYLWLYGVEHMVKDHSDS